MKMTKAQGRRRMKEIESKASKLFHGWDDQHEGFRRDQSHREDA